MNDLAKSRAKENLKEIWGKLFVRTYWPNFYRWEQIDDDHWSYVIYINHEEVERCPTHATEEEVDMRFHDLLEENGIEDDSMYERKPFNR